MPNKGTVLAACLSLGIVALSAQAANAAITIDFSFTNVAGEGNIPGTVTGEIFGLPYNGQGPATDVVITSLPAGFDLGPGPFDAFAPPQDVTINQWKLADGVISRHSSFQSLGGIGAFDLDIDVVDLTSPTPVTNALYNPTTGGLIRAYGYGGVTLTVVVPEPATWVLTLAGFAAVGAAASLRRRRSAAKMATPAL